MKMMTRETRGGKRLFALLTAALLFMPALFGALKFPGKDMPAASAAAGGGLYTLDTFASMDEAGWMLDYAEGGFAYHTGVKGLRYFAPPDVSGLSGVSMYGYTADNTDYAENSWIVMNVMSGPPNSANTWKSNVRNLSTGGISTWVYIWQEDYPLGVASEMGYLIFGYNNDLELSGGTISKAGWDHSYGYSQDSIKNGVWTKINIGNVSDKDLTSVAAVTVFIKGAKGPTHLFVSDIMIDAAITSSGVVEEKAAQTVELSAPFVARNTLHDGNTVNLAPEVFTKATVTQTELTLTNNAGYNQVKTSGYTFTNLPAGNYTAAYKVTAGTEYNFTKNFKIRSEAERSAPFMTTTEAGAGWIADYTVSGTKYSSNVVGIRNAGPGITGLSDSSLYCYNDTTTGDGAIRIVALSGKMGTADGNANWYVGAKDITQYDGLSFWMYTYDETLAVGAAFPFYMGVGITDFADSYSCGMNGARFTTSIYPTNYPWTSPFLTNGAWNKVEIPTMEFYKLKPDWGWATGDAGPVYGPKRTAAIGIQMAPGGVSLNETHVLLGDIMMTDGITTMGVKDAVTPTVTLIPPAIPANLDTDNNTVDLKPGIVITKAAVASYDLSVRLTGGAGYDQTKTVTGYDAATVASKLQFTGLTAGNYNATYTVTTDEPDTYTFVSGAFSVHQAPVWTNKAAPEISGFHAEPVNGSSPEFGGQPTSKGVRYLSPDEDGSPSWYFMQHCDAGIQDNGVVNGEFNFARPIDISGYNPDYLTFTFWIYFEGISALGQWSAGFAIYSGGNSLSSTGRTADDGANADPDGNMKFYTMGLEAGKWNLVSMHLSAGRLGTLDLTDVTAIQLYQQVVPAVADAEFIFLAGGFTFCESNAGNAVTQKITPALTYANVLIDPTVALQDFADKGGRYDDGEYDLSLDGVTLNSEDNDGSYGVELIIKRSTGTAIDTLTDLGEIAAYTFLTGDIYTLEYRVTDQYGNYTVESATIEITGRAAMPPKLEIPETFKYAYNVNEQVNMSGFAGKSYWDEPASLTFKVTGPDGKAVTVSNGKFMPELEGKYTIEITVTDGENNTKTETITITAAKAGGAVAEPAGGCKNRNKGGAAALLLFALPMLWIPLRRKFK